jgi:hypothetical protein
VGYRKLLDGTFENASINEMLDAIFSMSSQRMMKRILASPRFTMAMHIGADNDEIQQEEEEYDDHTNCGHEGLRDAIAELVSSFSDRKVFSFTKQFDAKVAEDELWGSSVAEGTNNRTCFVAEDILNVTRIQLRSNQPPKRTIDYVEDPNTGMKKRKRLRMSWDYNEGAEGETVVSEEEKEEEDDDDSELEYGVEHDEHRSEPEEEYACTDQEEGLETM